MQTTSKLKLNLPGDADKATPEDFNANFRALEGYVTSLTQVCSAHTPAALNLTQSLKQVSFGQIVKSGYVFSLSAGGVKVLESGFAMVDAHVNANNMLAADRFSMDIVKNGATFYQYAMELSYGWEATIDQTSKLFPVAANDILAVKVRNETAVRGAINAPATWMNVRFFKSLNF